MTIDPNAAALAFSEFSTRVAGRKARLESQYGRTPKLYLNPQGLEILVSWICHLTAPIATGHYPVNQIAGCEIEIVNDVFRLGLGGVMVVKGDYVFLPDLYSNDRVIPLFTPLWTRRGFMRVLYYQHIDPVTFYTPANLINPPTMPKTITIEPRYTIKLDVLREQPRIGFNVYVSQNKSAYDDIEREAARARFAPMAFNMLNSECLYLWEPEIFSVLFDDEKEES